MQKSARHSFSHPVEHLQPVTLRSGAFVVVAGGNQISVLPPHAVTTGAAAAAAYPRDDNLSFHQNRDRQGRQNVGNNNESPSFYSSANHANSVQTLVEQLLSDNEMNHSAVGNPNNNNNTLFLADTAACITSLAVAPFVGAETALGVVGTDSGSILLFLLQLAHTTGVPQLTYLHQAALSTYSNGRIPSAVQHARNSNGLVGSVAIGIDPAGRPEFVAAATAQCLVLLDIALLLSFSKNENLDSNNNSAASLSALGVAAVMRSLGNDNPHKNEPLVCVFPLHTQIIKVIAPTRYNAAFSLDCALLIVFDNGEVQYVKRHVSGGSVPLLISHHRRRQASSSMEEVYRLLLLSAEEQQKQDGLGTLSSSKTHLHAHRDNEILYGTLPHITYQYQLSPKSKFSFATPDGGVFINDAQLLYDKTAGDMLLVVAGGERTYVAHKQNNNNNRVANSYDRLSSSSAVTSTKQYNETRLSGSVAAENNNNNNNISVRVAPFWGIAEHAVLPLYATENIIKKENQFSHNNNHPKNIEVRVLAHTVSLPEVQQQSLHDHHHNNINTFRYHAARQSAFSSVSVLPNSREKETGMPLLFSSLQNLYQTTSSFQKQNSENINNSRLPQLAHVFSASSVMEEVAVADGAVLYGSNSEVSVLRF